MIIRNIFYISGILYFLLILQYSRQWSIRGNARNIEKLKKKLAEQETTLVMESPHLVFKLKGKGSKPHYLLVSSDYERNDWRETINGLKSKGHCHSVGNLTTVELQNQINSLSVCSEQVL